MPRGRPRKPRLHQPGMPPQPLAGIPEAPEHLTAFQRQAWDELVRVLGPTGTLTQADAIMMEQWCVSYETWREACAWLKAPTPKEWGKTRKAAKKVLPGNTGFYQSPWLAVANRAAEDLRKISDRLGLDPKSREKLKADVGPKLAEDPKARFFKAREA